MHSLYTVQHFIGLLGVGRNLFFLEGGVFWVRNYGRGRMLGGRIWGERFCEWGGVMGRSVGFGFEFPNRPKNFGYKNMIKVGAKKTPSA